jgi:Galactosyltransferase.
MTQFSNKLNKKLTIVVPYRNRPKQYEIFLFHSKIYFNEDKLDKYLNLKLCFLEQANDKPFNLGSLNNAGFLINENYLDYIVINNVDFLPMITDYSYSESPMLLIKHGYNNLPIVPSKDRRLIVKSPKRENVFLGSILIPKNIFKKVNGYSNSYWGWGFEDPDMKKRLNTK